MDVISAYQDVGNLAGSGFDQHGTRKASRLAERGTRQLHSTTGGLRLPAFQDRVTWQRPWTSHSGQLAATEIWAVASRLVRCLTYFGLRRARASQSDHGRVRSLRTGKTSRRPRDPVRALRAEVTTGRSTDWLTHADLRKLRFVQAICIPFVTAERLSALQGRSTTKTSSSSNYRLGAVGRVGDVAGCLGEAGPSCDDVNAVWVLRLCVNSRRAARTSLAARSEHLSMLGRLVLADAIRRSDELKPSSTEPSHM